MRKIVSFGLWACALLANAYLATRWLTGDRFLAVRLANYFLPWIGCALLICLAAALLYRCRKVSVALMVPLGVIGSIYAPFFFHCLHCAAAEGPVIKVMSYNVMSDNEDMAACAALIKHEKPDILLLQEINHRNLQELLADLDDVGAAAPLKAAYDDENLGAIISRFSIEYFDRFPGKNRAQKARLESPYGSLTVINVHAVRSGWSVRHRGMEELLEDVLSENGPLILAGDFNTTEQSQTFQFLEKHLVNTHNEAGCGFGFSFPARTHSGIFFNPFGLKLLPFIRIDHIFHNDQLTTLKSYTASDSGGSDHFPVIAELAFKNARGEGAWSLRPEAEGS